MATTGAPLPTPNICKSDSQTTDNHKIKHGELIVLPKLMERPHGCCFISSKPSTLEVALGQRDGPESEVIINSGSDITLVSQKTISSMKNPPKEHTGKKVTLSQVTAKTSIRTYVDLPLFFETTNGPVQINVEAYVVKGMTTPIILGNDYADQYALSIERKNGNSTLQFADSGRSIRLNNSTTDIHLPKEVKTFIAQIKRKSHLIRKKARKKESSGRTFFLINQNQTIPPFSSKLITITIQWPPEVESLFLIPDGPTTRRLAPLRILDSIIDKGRNTIIAENSTDIPLKLIHGERLGRAMELQTLDKNPNQESSEEIARFTHLTRTIFQSFKEPPGNKEEQKYAEKQPEQPIGPKTAEVPEFKDIPTKHLLSSLDINPKLNSTQRKAMEKVLVKNHLAFSLDGRIGKYKGIKYEIKLIPEAQPISLAPYHASPEKREAINKQLDKWFKQDVIAPVDSPWGAPVIVVYRFGKQEYA